MKTTTIIAAAALSLFAAGAAQAQQATYELPLPATSTTSRASVLAELQQARAAGYQGVTEGQYPVLVLAGASRSRAEVNAETAAAIASGESQLANAEPHGFANNAQNRSELLAPVRMASNTR
ncbi:MAG: DUF4148 domain-containing protein [Rubrivivax sp.]|nr:DUF4148 domain-containing protein [Rubrivivax sp.]MDP3085747.1 DUF4148 domain-containing protein [Rubrivivax sp.]